MTLMEAVVALVILALVAVGCLELTQGASNLERWLQMLRATQTHELHASRGDRGSI